MKIKDQTRIPNKSTFYVCRLETRKIVLSSDYLTIENG